MAIHNPDFTQEYVLNVTLNHMTNCINRSINKTIQRMNDADQSKSQEYLMTLVSLEKLNRMMQEIKDNNELILGGPDND